jgi:hypothetical protein
MGSNTKAKGKTRPAEDHVQDENTSSSDASVPQSQETDYSYSAPMDTWMLKYDVNENGVGHILLPPSLSILLQSDRISIEPFAGGLLIRSM